MNPGKAEEIPTDMLKTASNMIGRMSPEELQNMMKMASTFQGEKGSNFIDKFGPGPVPLNLSPEMLKTAGDMMGKMSPEELRRMFEMASSLKQNSIPSSSSDSGPGSSSGRLSSESETKFTETRDLPVHRNNVFSECSSLSGSYSDLGSTFQASYPTSMGDMQEQMRNQMKDPAMRQVSLIQILLHALYCFNFEIQVCYYILDMVNDVDALNHVLFNFVSTRCSRQC